MEKFPIPNVEKCENPEGGAESPYEVVSISNLDIYSEDFKQILAIEQSIFGEKAFPEEVMKSDLSNPMTILAVLKDNGVIIGFAYAEPESKRVSCISDIAIAREYQGKGLVAPLMARMEEELKRSGYKWMTEHAMVENGYADKVQKNYAARIIKSEEFVGEYGKQRYFKIRL